MSDSKKKRYKLLAPGELSKKDSDLIKKLLTRTEDRGCTVAEAETAEAKLLEILDRLELERDEVDLEEIVPKSKTKTKVIKEFDFVLDPPIRAGLVYDDAKEKHLIGRYIYLQEDDQELLDAFCRSWLNTWKADKNFFLCLDLETHGLNPILEDSDMLLQCLSWDGETALVFEHQKFDLTLYKEVLNTIPLANHNIKFDVKWLIHHLGVDPIIMWDTMVCAQIGWAGVFPVYLGKKYSLDNVVMQMLPPLRMSKAVRKEFYTKKPATGFSRTQIEYAVRDALLTFRLVKPQMIRLKNKNLLALWEEVELPLLNMMVEVELKGIPVNVDTAFKLLKTKEAELVERREELGKLIRELPEGKRPKPGPGGFYNPMSSKQLPLILGAIGVRVADTQAKTLEMARANNPHEILAKIIEYRQLANQVGKLLKKLCTQFIDLKTNKIYPTNNTCGAETGRLSVQDPPLHQIQEWTRPVIEAPEGWCLLGRDYSQFEFRAIAAYSEEPALIRLFEERDSILQPVRNLCFGIHWTKADKAVYDPDEFCKKLFSHKEKDMELMAEARAQLTEHDSELLKQFARLDIHRANAAKIFDKDPDEVSGEERSVCKTLGYAVLYGAGVAQVRAQLAADGHIYSEKACNDFRDAFFEYLPRVQKFIKEAHGLVNNNGSACTVLGRQRFFALPPKYMTRDYAKAKADGERESVNYFCQASNADATKRSMVILYEEWANKYPVEIRPRTIISVHDELVTLCPEHLADEVDAFKEQVMVECGLQSIGRKCPVEVSGSRMISWTK